MTPALPPGFKLDPIPDLPAGFKLDPVEPTSKEEPQKKDDRLPFGVPGGREHKTFAETVGPESTLGKAATFLGKVSQFVPKAETVMGLGSMAAPGEAFAAGVPAIVKRGSGMGAALGTGWVTDKGLQYLGMPAWLSEIIATGAGVAVGGRVGLSPETIETLKSSGVQGVLQRWFKGPPTENEAFKFYEETHGVAPKTGAEKLTARAEAAAFKKKVQEATKTPAAPKQEPRPGSGATVKKFGGSTNPFADLGGTRGPQRVGKAVRDEPVEPPAPVEDLFAETRGKLGKQLGRYTPASEARAGMGGKAPQRYGKVIGRMEASEASAEEKADELIEKTTKEPLKPKEASSGVAPMGKLKIRADIFSNVDQLATKAGANKVEFKKSFRELVEKKYGKGLSEMNEDELMQVANSVQDLLKGR